MPGGVEQVSDHISSLVWLILLQVLGSFYYSHRLLLSFSPGSFVKPGSRTSHCINTKLCTRSGLISKLQYIWVVAIIRQLVLSYYA